MTFETAKTVIDHFAEFPLKIQFAGGEPLLNFDLIKKVYMYIREKSIDAVFQLQTNGTLIDSETAAELKRMRFSVGVSLDGIPDVNERTRGQSLKVVNGIKALGRVGMMTGINAVVTSENVRALPSLVDFALYLGNVGGIGLDLLRHAGRGKDEKEELGACEKDLRDALCGMYKRSIEIYRLSGKKIEIREIELARKRLAGEGNRENYCYASCGRSVVVLPDGETYPCGSLILDEYCMGNVDELRPEKIISLATEEPHQCSSCEYGDCCPKGCQSRRIRNGNNLDCIMQKEAFRLAARYRY